MANNMNVTLKTDVTPNVLDIDDKGGKNKVDKNPNPQTISWNLTGNLAQGEFVSMSAAQPGFEWIQQPPAGVFGDPQIGSNGNSLNLVDNHPNDNSKGEWAYRLRVSLNGTVYQTTASTGRTDRTASIASIASTSNNPLIINR